MFKLFGKKKEEPKAPVAEEPSSPYKAFAAEFDSEELAILAVTSPAGFRDEQDAASGLWKAGVVLTAWMEEDTDDIHREPTPLEILADQELLGVLRQRLPGNFILKLKARLSLDGSRLMLTNLPVPGFDPDLKAILDEQKKPVSTWVDGLGTFTLSHTMNWFQLEVDWLDQTAQLTYDNGTEEEMKAAQQNARTLMADPAGWDEKVRVFAAHQLLALANQWAQDGAEEGEEPEEVTHEAFMECMELESILVTPEGKLEFWFNDGGLFWGHAIHVTATLTDGPTAAEMEG